MSIDKAIRSNIDRLSKTTGAQFPVAPVALVTGPNIELSVGDPDQPFWIASIDKVFIATLMMQFFQSGKISPETPIGNVLSKVDVEQLPVNPGIDAASDITVAHLLTHTSGLSDVFFPPRRFETDCSIENIRKAPDHIWTNSELLQQAKHLPALANPGSKFRYGDTAYILLEKILEELSGLSFTELIAKNIFEFCGMADTLACVNPQNDALSDFAEKLAPFQLGKIAPPESEKLIPNLTWRNEIGGASTANDLVRFQKALHAGELCDSRWVDFMSGVQNKLRPGIHYGEGMVTLRLSGFSPFLRGYTEPIGGLGSLATHMFYYPKERTHLILNFHSSKRMQSSFRAHIRLASLIKRAYRV